MKEYNTYFIKINEENEGITIHTHKEYELKKDDIFINDIGMCLVMYIGIRGDNKFSQFLCESLEDIEIKKVEK